MEKERLKKISALALATLPALACLAQALHFYLFNLNDLGLGFPIDDAYIFKRYAENLAAGRGFSFNPGETSFGCTSLVWPFLMAALIKALPFLDYVTIAFWLGALCNALTASGAFLVIWRASGRVAPALFGGMVIALCVPLSFIHAVSGMETPLTALLLVAFCAAALDDTPHPAAAGVIAGLLYLSRPENLYFPLGFFIAWAMVLPFKEKKPVLRGMALFAAAWLAVVLPSALWVHARTGTFLPGTYLGKIMASSPALLERGLGEKILFGVLSFLDGWKRIGWPLHFISFALMAGAAAETAHAIASIPDQEFKYFSRLRKMALAGREALTKEASAGRLILAGYMLLPGVYGFQFPVHPAFGGYYNRYIAPLFVVWVILGAIGIQGGLAAVSNRLGWKAKRERLVSIALLVLSLCYQGYLFNFQIKETKAVYAAEVRLNAGIRMEAAKWIADPANVPPGARVMVGYTGLGVVGGACDRYVLDLGALINPDIFEYYRDAPVTPEGRWKAVLGYMKDKGVTWYVTFAAPAGGQLKILDPAATPGFIEAARIGAQGEPSSFYEQIRIYRIDWERHENDESGRP